jgi:hypothetical protein
MMLIGSHTCGQRINNNNHADHPSIRHLRSRDVLVPETQDSTQSSLRDVSFESEGTAGTATSIVRSPQLARSDIHYIECNY